MRPIKLTVSAFGPYSGETVIELEKLGKSGIYLITGDTGAGKTTIFDAISFALFGEASGTARDSSMLRSKYALPETPTFVELVFSNGGKTYTVRRNPDFERPAKKGEGFTTQKAEATLTLPDGNLVTRYKEVTAAIRDIIGVDKDQFSQIAMIAQGDFMKLLHADTKDRQGIFREIFKTGYYQVLQDRLRTESGNLAKRYDEVQLSVRQYISGLLCDEEDLLFVELQKAKRGEMLFADLLLLVERLLEKDEALAEDLRTAVLENEKKSETVTAELTRAEGFERAVRSLNDAKAQREAVLPERDTLRKRLEELSAKAPEIDGIIKEKAELELCLSDYDRAEEARLRGERLKKEQADTLSLRERGAKRVVELTEELKRLKTEAASVSSAGEEKEKLLRQKEEQEKRLSAADDIIKDTETLARGRAKLAAARDKYRASAELSAKAAERYAEMNRAFLDGQAGILAETLTEGAPCPVCGSLSHPKKAVRPPEAPTEEALKAAKTAADRAAETASENSRAAGELSGKVDSFAETLSVKLAAFLGDLPETALNEKRAETEETLKRLAAELSAADVRIKRKNVLETEIPQREKTLEDEKAKVFAAENSLAALDAAVKENLTQLDELLKKLRFSGKEEASAQVDRLSAAIGAHKKAVSDAEESLSRSNAALERIEGMIAQLEKDTKDRPEWDMAALAEEKNRLLKEKAELTRRLQTVNTRIDTNRRAAENATARSDELMQVEKEWSWVKALSNTANGNVSGREKIMLETYIQGTFFDRILRRANTRLMVMTDGQYELKRRVEASNNRSQSGLELDVIDHNNGSTRSVKSLSGGESFKASLSLALGLSDEVRSAAGGIRLETMFVDEGFGSLDEESLSQAMKALSSLAEGDRLVGIISHVAELKERIEKQLVVTKDRSGSSRVTIIA